MAHEDHDHYRCADGCGLSFCEMDPQLAVHEQKHNVERVEDREPPTRAYHTTRLA